MFTGIVQHVGSVVAADPASHGIRLHVESAGWGHRADAGDSVAVDGCCLTAIAKASPAGLMTFDVVRETLARTTLGAWTKGQRVNLEHAATPSTLLGGHLVQGHIDGVGHVVLNEADSTGDWRLTVDVPAALARYLIPKGSVCLNGVSLTLARLEVGRARLEVALIPTTLAKTTLAALQPGEAVNVEVDATAKTIVHYLQHFAAAGATAGTVLPGEGS